MNATVISNIEESIFALPETEQVRLLARVSEVLRKNRQAEFERQLAEMADDPDIQREIQAIDREFRVTELDGLPE